MYNHYFGLTSSPFAIAPDPNYLYMSTQHRDALAHLVYGIQGNGGFVMLTGEIGTGKTTLCRCMLEHIPETADVAFILNPTLDSEQLLASICDELHISYDKNQLSIKTLSDAIYHHLLKTHAAGKNTILIIDEAQNLSPEVLEQMRLLTNLETNEKKLLQIIMFGQPELKQLISRPELKQLAQRITARFHLAPLKVHETELYINHRLSIAGYKPIAGTPSPIPEKLIGQIHHLSGGIPRLINIICDRALLGAYAQNAATITSEILYQAAKEVFGEDQKPPIQPVSMVTPAIVILSLMLIALLIHRFYPQLEHLITADSAPVTESTLSEITNPAMSAAQRMEVVEKIDTSLPVPEESEILEAVQVAEANEATPEQPVKSEALLPEPVNKKPATIEVTERVSNSVSPSAEQTPSAVKQPVLQQVTDSDQTPAIPPSEEPELQTIVNPELRAYHTLFALWQEALPKNHDPCDFALTRGLRCLHQQGSWHQLSKNNRPALVRVLNSEGLLITLTLKGIENGIATFTDGQNNWQTPLQQLDDTRLLNYTLLWRPPSGYHRLAKRGMRGPHIYWLKQQLEKMSPLFISNKSELFDEQLELYVKAFQRSQDLLQDGVVGPETLIRVNTIIAQKGPRLLSFRE